MCDPVTIAVAATAVSAGTSVMSGYQQKQMNKFKASQAEADAEAGKGEAMVRAEKIRKHTQARAASARAALAASGVDVGSESATLINKDIIKRGEEDALVGIDDSLDAARRLKASATTLRSAGNQAVIGGLAKAGSSVLDGYAKYNNGWYGKVEE